jgi:signal transduction histidine kinase
MSVQRQVQRPPLGRTLLASAVTAVVGGAGYGWAIAVAPTAARSLVAACLGVAAVLLCVAVAIAVYRDQEARHYRARLAAKDASMIRLAEDAVPTVVRRVREGASVDTALAEVPQPTGDGPQRRVLWAVAHEVGLGERRRAAAMAACANAAGRVQALATSMLADLREMEERHDEGVLGDLLRLDHNTAQAGRLADSIAVLTGARSGRRWTRPIVMESILRGAVGRIGGYQRVRLHSTLNVAVVGYAAEGVMHALAELMDNAAKFSPPSEQVHVYAEDVHAGVVITIEDGGLAMSQSALRRAERAVSAEPLDLATLSGTRLGLAVVGCLARKHGLTVSFRPSSWGGTGVVVMIPRVLITEPRDEFAPAAPYPGRSPMSAPSPAAVRSAEAAAAARPETANQETANQAAGDQAHGLPKRRRGQTFAAATSTASAGPVQPTTGPVQPSATAVQPAQSRADAGSRFSAFRKGSRGGSGRDTGESPLPAAGNPASSADPADSPAPGDDTG